MFSFSIKVTDESEWQQKEEWCARTINNWKGDLEAVTGINRNRCCGYLEWDFMSRSYIVRTEEQATMFILRWK